MSDDLEIAPEPLPVETFFLRWRGRQEGPYPLAVIEEKLSTNQIGLLHEINRNSQWLTLREFMAERQAVLRAQQQAREEQNRRDNEEREREDRLRAARLEEERLQELKRQNDLLQSRATSGTFGAQAAGGMVLQNRVLPKSRIAYIVLGLFLGLLGVHNFYAGYTTRAIIQLLVSIFTGWLLIPLIGVAVWVLIEICTVEEDAQGVRFQS